MEFVLAHIKQKSSSESLEKIRNVSWGNIGRGYIEAKCNINNRKRENCSEAQTPENSLLVTLLLVQGSPWKITKVNKVFLSDLDPGCFGLYTDQRHLCKGSLWRGRWQQWKGCSRVLQHLQQLHHKHHSWGMQLCMRRNRQNGQSDNDLMHHLEKKYTEASKWFTGKECMKEHRSFSENIHVVVLLS